jgi:hypothetical protein
MKSGWPGADQVDRDIADANDTTADLIVIPRCRSSASESGAVVDADPSRTPMGAEQPLVSLSYRRLHAPDPKFNVLTRRHVP